MSSAVAHCHVQKEPRVEEGLDDRPGHLEPALVVLELERLARALRHDFHEPRIERTLGRQRRSFSREVGFEPWHRRKDSTVFG